MEEIQYLKILKDHYPSIYDEIQIKINGVNEEIHQKILHDLMELYMNKINNKESIIVNSEILDLLIQNNSIDTKVMNVKKIPLILFKFNQEGDEEKGYNTYSDSEYKIEKCLIINNNGNEILLFFDTEMNQLDITLLVDKIEYMSYYNTKRNYYKIDIGSDNSIIKLLAYECYNINHDINTNSNEFSNIEYNEENCVLKDNCEVTLTTSYIVTTLFYINAK